MKKNTDDLKNHLRRALISVPDDFSLAEVKSHILRAIETVEHVDEKRSKRQSSMVERRRQNTFIPDVKSAYMAIESELASEKAKLEQLVKKKAGKPIEKFDNSEEMQNVFG